ncbi:MAG: recombinase family protein, partial [Lachnospiraceae bacterium]|nr:recombinase family protein [Lachnospiraceae bacterium]
TERIAGNMARKKTMEQFISIIETQEPITKFDEGLWSGLVDYVTVYSTKDIRVTFKDGTEIKA